MESDFDLISIVFVIFGLLAMLRINSMPSWQAHDTRGDERINWWCDKTENLQFTLSCERHHPKPRWYFSRRSQALTNQPNGNKNKHLICSHIISSWFGNQLQFGASFRSKKWKRKQKKKKTNFYSKADYCGVIFSFIVMTKPFFFRSLSPFLIFTKCKANVSECACDKSNKIQASMLN